MKRHVLFPKCSSPQVTKNYPNKLFYPNAATIDTMDILFASMKSNDVVNVYSRDEFLKLSSIPPRFRSEVGSYFVFENEILMRVRFDAAIMGLVYKYMSGCKLIEHRVNAFIRQILAEAEIAYFGKSTSQARELTHVDSLTLREITGNDLDLSNLSTHLDRPSLPFCFMSTLFPQQLRFENYFVRDRSIIQLDRQTRAMVQAFFSQFQVKYRDGSVAIDPARLRPEQLQDVQELWTLFGQSYGRQLDVLTPDKIENGLNVWAMNFVATDPVCQRIANGYCQAKLQYCIAVLLSDSGVVPQPPSVAMTVAGPNLSDSSHFANLRQTGLVTSKSHYCLPVNSRSMTANIIRGGTTTGESARTMITVHSDNDVLRHSSLIGNTSGGFHSNRAEYSTSNKIAFTKDEKFLWEPNTPAVHWPSGGRPKRVIISGKPLRADGFICIKFLGGKSVEKYSREYVHPSTVYGITPTLNGRRSASIPLKTFVLYSDELEVKSIDSFSIGTVVGVGTAVGSYFVDNAITGEKDMVEYRTMQFLHQLAPNPNLSSDQLRSSNSIYRGAMHSQTSEIDSFVDKPLSQKRTPFDDLIDSPPRVFGDNMKTPATLPASKLETSGGAFVSPSTVTESSPSVSISSSQVQTEFPSPRERSTTASAKSPPRTKIVATVASMLNMGSKTSQSPPKPQPVASNTLSISTASDSASQLPKAIASQTSPHGETSTSDFTKQSFASPPYPDSDKVQTPKTQGKPPIAPLSLTKLLSFGSNSPASPRQTRSTSPANQSGGMVSPFAGQRVTSSKSKVSSPRDPTPERASNVSPSLPAVSPRDDDNASVATLTVKDVMLKGMQDPKDMVLSRWLADKDEVDIVKRNFSGDSHDSHSGSGDARRNPSKGVSSRNPTPKSVRSMSSPQVSPRAMDEPDEDLTSYELFVLRALLVSSGEMFLLKERVQIPPRFVDEFDLFFTVSGVKYFFQFSQRDYGITFNQYLGDDYFPPSLRLTTAGEKSFDICSGEINRCFFIHLGAAINIHPFTLQSIFRIAAFDILSRPASDAAVFFGECLRSIPEDSGSKPGILNRSGVFVDATALLAIWIEELDDTRILICKLDSGGSLEHLTLFEPVSGPRNNRGDWFGRDVILANQFGHFTLLVPENNDPLPITRLMTIAHQCALEHGTTEPLVYKISPPEGAPRYSMGMLRQRLASKP